MTELPRNLIINILLFPVGLKNGRGYEKREWQRNLACWENINLPDGYESQMLRHILYFISNSI